MKLARPESSRGAAVEARRDDAQRRPADREALGQCSRPPPASSTSRTAPGAPHRLSGLWYHIHPTPLPPQYGTRLARRPS
ncbi:unnamed protein product [Parajaminaea phylloscopi]